MSASTGSGYVTPSSPTCAPSKKTAPEIRAPPSRTGPRTRQPVIRSEPSTRSAVACRPGSTDRPRYNWRSCAP
ncbi:MULTISPECIES: hypothetical protein [unclassified Streptomyces]|uniref:hypothetical protein n=1 Tax=unclassified Streptomyces TaxID=2593676 RepID=UPI0033C12085